MITGILEGSIGYLKLASGIKYAFAADVKEILNILPGYIQYVSIKDEEKTINFLQSGGCIRIIS